MMKDFPEEKNVMGRPAGGSAQLRSRVPPAALLGRLEVGCSHTPGAKIAKSWNVRGARGRAAILRGGYHAAQDLLKRFGVGSTGRSRAGSALTEAKRRFLWPASVGRGGVGLNKEFRG